MEAELMNIVWSINKSYHSYISLCRPNHRGKSPGEKCPDTT